MLFNSRRYFEAHDAWEEAWREETGESRRLLQGLIQVAAGLLKASRGRQSRGCVLLLEWGAAKLLRVGDRSAGLALSEFLLRLETFREQARSWHSGQSGPPSPGGFPKLRRARQTTRPGAAPTAPYAVRSRKGRTLARR